MIQRTVVVLVTAAVMLAAAVAGQADDALRWRIKQLQAQAEAEAARLQGAQQVLSGAQDELAGTQSALAEEQERHRSTRSILAGVRQALEQASAAVVKLRWAQTRQDEAHAAAQAEVQAELLEAQQRQWQAEQDAVSLRQALSQANATVAGLQAQVANAQDETSDAQESLTETRQTLSDARSALAAEQGRYRVAAQVLSSTQQQLAESSARSAQLQLELDDVNRVAAVRRDMLASVQRQLRGAQTLLVQGQEREAVLQQGLSQTRQRLAQAEAESARLQGAQQALSGAQDELAGTQAALAEEQQQHRSTRGILAGVRQALEQASAAVVKLRWAQTRQDQAHAVAQQAVQAELLEAQQRQWQAEQDAVSLRQALSQAQQNLAQASSVAEQMNRDLMDAQAQGESVQLILASAREELARTRRALEREQGRNAAQGEVLANTQAALSETSASLAEVRAAMAEQAEAHANAQAASQSDKQQWVERFWDMERQNNKTRVALRRAEQAYTETQQALDQTTRQAQIDGIRQSQLHRDLTAAQTQVEATQTALSETSASLAEVRAAMAEQAEAHASAQAASQSDKRQWVERFWDMERQNNKTRVALRRTEQAHEETQQALDDTTRQAQIDGIRQSQLRRDVMEARQALDRMAEPAAGVKELADLVRQRFADEIQQNQLSVRAGRRRVKLASADIFDFVKAVELGSRSVQTLDRLAELLQEMPSYQVRFAVHTDSIPLRQGSKWPTNWELSTARAAKLVRYLIDKGVAGERLSTGGYGEYRPVADNDTPEGRRQNRRVEVVIKLPRQQ